MFDIARVREHPDLIQKAAKEKNIEIDVHRILKVDSAYRELSSSVQNLRADRNRYAKEKNIEKGKELKEKLAKEEQALSALDEELKLLLSKIPNPANSDVKPGKNDTENDVIKTVGSPRKFDFPVRDHLELGETLGIVDMKRAAKVSGARFVYLTGDAVFLEFALIRYAFDVLTKEGFTPVIPPTLIKTETMKKLGYMENGGDEDMFHVEKDGMTLVGTAEHSIVSMHMDEIFQSSDLPKRYVGFSSAFRREAGSYGKDTRGILRVHQFDKVEMVSFTTKEADDKEHDFLLSLEEKMFQALNIPFQVIKMCTGDLGFPAARKYDIEAWIPSQKKFREVTSTSTTTDFQSRRLNIKYRNADKTEYASILNGTAFAIGRTLIAILENYQEKDGSVIVPEILRPYTGFDKITLKTSK